MYFDSEGIVLKKQVYNEKDRILVVLTKNIGRIEVIAKGINRPTSKLQSITEPIVCANFTFYKKKLDGPYRLITGLGINYFPMLRQKIIPFLYGFQIVEIAYFLSSPYSNLIEYEFVLEALELLDEGKEPEKIFLTFVINFLKFAGYGIDLKNIDPELAFYINRILKEPIETIDMPPYIIKQLDDFLYRYLKFLNVQLNSSFVKSDLLSSI